MKRNIFYTAKVLCLAALPLLGAGCLTSCQDKDYEFFETVMTPITDSDITKAEFVGDDYVIEWNALPEGTLMQVDRYIGNTLNATDIVDGRQYVHKEVDTNVPYTYVLKTTDSRADDRNVSKGVVLNYMREGASRVKNISLAQLDNETTGGYDIEVTWDKCADASKGILVKATNGKRTEEKTVAGDATKVVISGVQFKEEWEVTVVALGEKGNSLASHAALRIGSTLIGFLADYDSPEDLVARGDDDEACAWLWLHSEYKNAQFVPFKSIKSDADIEAFRVLFWLRDIETGRFEDVFAYSADVQAATPFVSKWYKAGGSLLLWSHAVPYIEQIGRLPIGTFTAEGADPAVGTGAGWNDEGAHWVLAVSAYPDGKFKIDYSTHPIYRGFESEIQSVDGDTWKNIRFLGPGWREDHNCLFHNLPGKLTGKGNQDKACYDVCTSQYGIYPLGTWDGQRNWIGQLNVWEAQQGNTDCKGTVICIGNGGCEFAQNNPDGTKPVPTARPRNNMYQDNILRLAKNSLEYLKTR